MLIFFSPKQLFTYALINLCKKFQRQLQILILFMIVSMENLRLGAKSFNSVEQLF